MQFGDVWSSDSAPATPTPDPFLCENTIFNHVCPNSCGFLCPIYVKNCSGHSGTFHSAVVGEGPVTLPSGHTFQSLVVRNVSDYCVYTGSSCLFAVDQVRTVVHLWQVPQLGTVARLMSAQVAPDTTSFTTLVETDFKFGLFPPRAIEVAAVTDSSVELAWDPGLETHRVDAYKVYWDTDSGAVTAYANSVVQPAQDGTTATITGLDPGIEYFFTVTSLSDYTNPASGTTLTFESLVYPTTVGGGPEPVPMEVSAVTTGGTCVPTAPVTNLTVAKAAGGDVELCWDPATDPCLVGYRVLGADAPESAAGFAVVVDTDLATCRTLTPADTYYLVVTRGTGGTGPWDHYGQ